MEQEFFYRYETATIPIQITPIIALDDYKHIIVSIAQENKKKIINKTEDDMDIDTETGIISFDLSQEETSIFDVGIATIQVNIYYNSKTRDVSGTAEIEVRNNLYKKVMG